MGGSEQGETTQVADPPRVDRLLRFDPDTAARFERDGGTARGYHLRYTIWLGLILYNIYNITGALLMPDIVVPATVLRIAVVTPVSLLLAWAVVHLSARWREGLTLLAMINAYLLPVGLFGMTRADLGNFTFGELTLALVFANMLLALRFQHAIIFTSLAVATTLVVLILKPGLPPQLHIALGVQIVTAGVFSLTANYLMERRRCHDYATALIAMRRAERAEGSQQQLTEISQTDALTGLPNRRYLDQTLTRWCAGPHRLCVMMIDVDHFKLFNDSLGHPAGDDCLRRLAAVFRATVPAHDAFCARFGGEEFTIVLRNATNRDAQELAERFVDAVRALAIPHPGRHDHSAVVTVSIGLTDCDGAATSADELLADADVALYQAKHGGRDQVATFGMPRHRGVRSA